MENLNYGKVIMVTAALAAAPGMIYADDASDAARKQVEDVIKPVDDAQKALNNAIQEVYGKAENGSDKNVIWSQLTKSSSIFGKQIKDVKDALEYWVDKYAKATTEKEKTEILGKIVYNGGIESQSGKTVTLPSMVYITTFTDNVPKISVAYNALNIVKVNNLNQTANKLIAEAKKATSTGVKDGDKDLDAYEHSTAYTLATLLNDKKIGEQVANLTKDAEEAMAPESETAGDGSTILNKLQDLKAKGDELVDFLSDETGIIHKITVKMSEDLKDLHKALSALYDNAYSEISQKYGRLGAKQTEYLKQLIDNAKKTIDTVENGDIYFKDPTTGSSRLIFAEKHSKLVETVQKVNDIKTDAKKDLEVELGNLNNMLYEKWKSGMMSDIDEKYPTAEIKYGDMNEGSYGAINALYTKHSQDLNAWKEIVKQYGNKTTNVDEMAEITRTENNLYKYKVALDKLLKDCDAKREEIKKKLMTDILDGEQYITDYFNDITAIGNQIVGGGSVDGVQYDGFEEEMKNITKLMNNLVEQVVYEKIAGAAVVQYKNYNALNDTKFTKTLFAGATHVQKHFQDLISNVKVNMVLKNETVNPTKTDFAGTSFGVKYDEKTKTYECNGAIFKEDGTLKEFKNYASATCLTTNGIDSITPSAQTLTIKGKVKFTENDDFYTKVLERINSKINTLNEHVENAKTAQSDLDKKIAAKKALDDNMEKVNAYWTQAYGQIDITHKGDAAAIEKDREELSKIRTKIDAQAKAIDNAVAADYELVFRKKDPTKVKYLQWEADVKNIESQQDAIIKTLNQIYNEIYPYAEPEKGQITAEKTAAAKAAVDNLDAAIKAAEETAKDLTLDVSKTKAQEAIEAARTALKTAQESYDSATAKLAGAGNDDLDKVAADAAVAKAAVESAMAEIKKSDNLPGDYNQDGKVDATDLETVYTDYETTQNPSLMSKMMDIVKAFINSIK